MTAASALCVAATVREVYRGGTTWNDHAVAALVTGMIALYPALWLGEGTRSLPLALALAPGPIAIWGLFHALGRRRDAGALIWLARLAQPAQAFALWAGLLIVLRAPVALYTGAPLLWPGPWLWLPFGLAAWGTAWTYLRADAVRRHPLPGPPLRLVHVSDIHVSPTYGPRDLDALLTRVEALAPDVVLVTGDLLMPFSEDHHDYLVEGLGRLAAPVLCCPGNHDLPVLERLVAELDGVGVRMLVDRSAVVEVGAHRIEVTGVNFTWRGARDALRTALAGLPPPDADYRVLLAHDPRLFDWVPEGRFDLVLSGHTHGGQVAADMFGVEASVLRLFGVHDQGWFHRGAMRQYVHRGNWHTGLPPRMGVAGEIAVFEVGQA